MFLSYLIAPFILCYLIHMLQKARYRLWLETDKCPFRTLHQLVFSRFYKDGEGRENVYFIAIMCGCDNER